LLTIYLLGVVLFAGFVNPILSDDDREWWARSSGYLLFFTALWLIIFGVSLCGDIFPSLFDWFSHGFKGGAASP
jgi:protein-S-isoprenylcysteine O-methyltransferase Ste14